MKVILGDTTVNNEGIFPINNPLTQERKNIIMVIPNRDKSVEGLYTFRLGVINNNVVTRIGDGDWEYVCAALKNILLNNTPMIYKINGGVLVGNINELNGLNIPVQAVDNYRENTKQYYDAVTYEVTNYPSSAVTSNEGIVNSNPTSNIHNINDMRIVKMQESIKSIKEALKLLEDEVNQYSSEHNNTEEVPYSKAA